jgi:N-acetylmuramoyl-L-alanine amidase
MNVVIDPGHGGDDPGAVVRGLKEKDFNLDIGLKIAWDLALRGHSVIMTRDSDTTMSLASRCAIANSSATSVFVSIHCNAAQTSRACGFEIWTSRGVTMADLLASSIHESLTRRFPFMTAQRADWADGDPDREAVTGERQFMVLVRTVMTAVLIECGFMTNPRDLELLSNSEWRSRMARAIAEGIHRELLERRALLIGGAI